MPTWNDPAVLAINFFFSEAARAANNGAKGDTPADRNARNARNYINLVMDYAVTDDLDADQDSPDGPVAGIASV